MGLPVDERRRARGYGGHAETAGAVRFHDGGQGNATGPQVSRQNGGRETRTGAGSADGQQLLPAAAGNLRRRESRGNEDRAIRGVPAGAGVGLAGGARGGGGNCGALEAIRAPYALARLFTRRQLLNFTMWDWASISHAGFRRI